LVKQSSSSPEAYLVRVRVRARARVKAVVLVRGSVPVRVATPLGPRHALGLATLVRPRLTLGKASGEPSLFAAHGGGSPHVMEPHLARQARAVTVRGIDERRQVVVGRVRRQRGAVHLILLAQARWVARRAA